MASLTIVVDGVEQKIPLEAATVTLGRGLESDVRLKDIKASRRHCQIVKGPKGYQCVDLSSGNGTYVNGVQIKSLALSSGDKITIGSTTIAFEDMAPRASASPKAATAKLPVAPAAPPRTPTAKVPADNVQVAPTRKITARVDAAKPASQGAIRSASQPTSKSASRVGKVTGRTPGPRAARPQSEPPKKRSPVLLIAVAAAVLAVVGGGAFFLLGSKDAGDQIRAQIEQLEKKGAEAEKAERFELAIQEYRKALELCQGDRFKVRASDLQKRLNQLESRRVSGTGNVPARPDVKEPPDKGPDFATKRTEISDKFRLAGDSGAADWSGAAKEWGDYLKGRPSTENKAKAEEELHTLHLRAKEEADRLRMKAEALAQENKMAEAVDLLKQQLARFEYGDLQDLHAELQAAIQKYDK